MKSLIYPHGIQNVFWRLAIWLRVELQTDGNLGTVLGYLDTVTRWRIQIRGLHHVPNTYLLTIQSHRPMPLSIQYHLDIGGFI